MSDLLTIDEIQEALVEADRYIGADPFLDLLLRKLMTSINQLTAERDEALAKVEAHGMVDHCVCRFESDGETQKVWCLIHANLRDERDAKHEALQKSLREIDSLRAQLGEER